LDIELNQALALLAQPRTRGRQRGAPKEPLKAWGPSPVTGDPVKLLDGRYGPYVTDGQTNASLPKGSPAEELTFERALQLLADKAAKGTTRRRAPKKRTAKKTHAKKTHAKKKGAKKKGAKKKGAKKKGAKK
jgi:DNA topoisomerase-1